MRDVEEAILRGFITCKVKLNNNFIIMKSTSARELQWANRLYFIKQDEFLDLALSIYKWNNVNFLLVRGKELQEIVNFLKELPYPFLETLLSNYKILIKRLFKAGEDLQKFVYTEASMWAWACRKGQNINKVCFTGLEGTDNLILNDIQEAWCYLNRLEDNIDINDAIWDNTKYILQYLAPKMRSTLNNFDRQRKKRRETLREEFSQEGTSGLIESDGIYRIPLDEEELLRQVRVDREGKKDLHDIIIEKTEKQLLERLKDDYKRVSELRISKGEGDLPVDSESKPITSEDMAERIKNRRIELDNIKPMYKQDDDIRKAIEMSRLSEDDKEEFKSLALKQGTYTLTEEEKIKVQHNSMVSDTIKKDENTFISGPTYKELIKQLEEEPK